MYKIMTAGPTQVRENVRQARSLVSTNPDLDEAFYDFYKETCDILAQLMHSSGRAYILGGEVTPNNRRMIESILAYSLHWNIE